MGKQIEEVIEILHEAFKLNAQDTYRLLTTRIPVSQDFARDSEFICYPEGKIPNESASVTALGMLNGILEALEIGKVAMKFSDRGHIFIGFMDAAKVDFATAMKEVHLTL